MTNCVATSPETVGILDKPICLPLKIVLSPLIWLINKVVRAWTVFAGWGNSLGIFSNGKWNRSWCNRKIIELYKGGCYDTHNRLQFDPVRLGRAFESLVKAGMTQTETWTKDGIKLDSMLIRYRDILEKIKAHGGSHVFSLPVQWDKGDRTEVNGKTYHLKCTETSGATDQFIDIIIPDADKCSKCWNEFSAKTLAKFGVETLELTRENGEVVRGYVTKHWNNKEDKRNADGDFIRTDLNLPIIAPCAPTEVKECRKRTLLQYVLAHRADVYAYDYRGSGKNEGAPSEGGYYLGLEAAVEKMRDFYGHKISRMLIDGFCLAGGVVAHAKRKYHKDGINIITQNTFCCLLHTLKNQIWPANLLSPSGVDEVRSRDPRIKALLGKFQEDSFNTVKKYSELEGKEGVMIIINTASDKTVDPKTHERTISVAKRVSKHCKPIWFEGGIPGANNHSFNVMSDLELFNQVSRYIIAIDHPEVLEA